MSHEKILIFESWIWYAATFLTAVTSFLNVLIVALTGRNINRKTSIKYILYASALTFWSINVFIFSWVPSEKLAYVSAQFLHLGAIFIPVFLLDFVLYFFKITGKYYRFELVSVYVLSVFFAVVDIFFPHYFISEVVPKRNYPFFLNAGPFYIWWVSLFTYIVISAHLKVFSRYKSAAGVEKDRLGLFVFPSLIAYVGCVAYFLPVYNFFFFPYPLGCFGSVVLSSALAYGILRHKLLGVDVILKKTLVFAGLLTFVFGVFSAATLLVREVLSVYLKVSTTGTYVVSLFLIVLGYDPIRNILINLTDNYLFQKKYDYQKFLKEASRGMSRIKSLEHLLNLVVHFITMKMRVENAAVLTRRVSGAGFNLQYQRGYKELPNLVLLTEGHPLIEYFRCEKEGLDAEQVQEMIESAKRVPVRGKENAFYDFQEIKAAMAELYTACCIPSFLGQELRNVLLLGSKKSGEYFTEEDRNVLYTLAQESAIAIENARLYDEAINKTRELERINHQLEDAKGSLTTALNETERANKQLQDTQAQLIHEQKMATLGRLAASVGHEVNNPLTILSMNVSRALMRYKKNPEVKVSEILDIFQKMEQNISRIKAVVNTLTGLLKKSEKGKFEPLSLKLILEETLPLVQFQTYLENLAGTEVEFNVPGNIPLIRGDLERLQEVFLNLFINAYHAMEGRPSPRINVRAELSPDGHYVMVHFTDSGKGMNEETMKRIFNYGYTTKPAGKGSGLGLYMCKYIIELHGGTIQVSSEEGVGTTFSLSLPAFDEIENLSGHEYRTAG